LGVYNTKIGQKILIDSIMGYYKIDDKVNNKLRNLMKLRVAIISTSCLFVSACAPIQQQTYQAPAQTQAQIQAAQIRSNLQNANSASTACAKAARESSAGQIVAKNILVMDEAQPNKFDLLSSKARLTEAQKTAFKQFLTASAECRKKRLDGLAGTSSQSIQIKVNSDKDLVYTKLLTGQMTVGDANMALKQINMQASDAFRAADASRNQALQSQSNAEIANRNRQQMCNGLAQKIRENDPSQNAWLAFNNGIQAANASAGNYGNGGVAMANQNKMQQQQLLMQLQDQYTRAGCQ
jgi:hypothetical protein